MEIRDTCIIICAPIFTLGVILLIYRNAFQTPERIITSFVFIFVVAAMIAFYPSTIIKSADIVADASSSTSLKVEKAMNEWQQAKIDGEESTFNFTARFAKVVFYISFAVAGIVRNFLSYLQRMGFYFLIAASPVILSLLLIQETSGIAVNFLMFSLALIMWPIGYNLSDMMIVSGWNTMMHQGIVAAAQLCSDPEVQTAVLGSTGTVASVTFLYFLPSITALLALKIALFFLLGTIIFNIMGVVIIITLLYGGNPVQAATGVMTAVTSYSNAVIGNTLDKIGGGKDKDKNNGPTMGLGE